MYILWIARCAVTELNNPAMTCLATGTLNRLVHVLYPPSHLWPIMSFDHFLPSADRGTKRP